MYFNYILFHIFMSFLQYRVW